MTNKPDLTAGANAAKATTRTSKSTLKSTLKSTSTRTKDDLDNNPVIQAIREIGIQTLAKTFQKTPAAIHAWQQLNK